MILGDAITTLRIELKDERLRHWPGIRAAMQLGIEALDAISRAREEGLYIPSSYRLPSETKE